jgi:hypothetical protein
VAAVGRGWAGEGGSLSQQSNGTPGCATSSTLLAAQLREEEAEDFEREEGAPART